jgi:hypothetical protein
MMRTWILAALSLPLAAQSPTLFFSKSFPNSRPAYYEIRLDRTGQAEYRETPEEEPLRCKLAPQETETMFLLSDKLKHFEGSLESGLNVAKMGEKTFRWTQGAETHEAKFNYSTDPDAQALLDWFEKISESAQVYYDLERTAKFDKLGVNKSLLRLESAWDKNRLVGVEQYLPLLDRVAKNESYLNMARDRAARLAEVFRNPPPRNAPPADGSKK